MIAPALKRGGMERQLSLLLARADRSRLRITLALVNSHVHYPIPEDVDVIHLQQRFRFNPLFLFRLISLFMSSRYDVINSKSGATNFHIMVLAGLLRKKNLILEIRTSMDNPKGLERMPQMFRWFKLPWQVVCNSKRTANALQSIMPAEAIHFIPNGIDTEVFNRKEGMRAPVTVGYLGRIHPLKKIETLLEAFAEAARHYPLVRLSICGPTLNEAYLRELKLKALQSTVADRITFTEATHDAPAFLNTLEVFVLPSEYEGTPNALLEAMSCECVCLVSAGANTDNFLASELVFDTNNASQLAQLLTRWFAASPAERSANGKYNRSRVVQHYGVSAMVEAYTQLIERITA
jgi:glycosyltransferase involved in cell wall biosynthesis